MVQIKLKILPILLMYDLNVCEICSTKIMMGSKGHYLRGQPWYVVDSSVERKNKRMMKEMNERRIVICASVILSKREP